MWMWVAIIYLGCFAVLLELLDRSARCYSEGSMA
jgi:hypothetical protein